MVTGAQTFGRLLLILVTALLSACATTRFSSEAPTSLGQPGQRLLLMVSATDANLGLVTENQLLADISPLNHASTAHQLGIDGQPTDAAVRVRIAKAGFDRVLILRVAGIEKRRVEYPATPYGYGDPWMWGWPPGWRSFPFGPLPYIPFDSAPPRIVEELAVSVETQLIAMPSGEILWRGLSHTLTDGTAAQALEEASASVVKKLGDRHWLISN